MRGNTGFNVQEGLTNKTQEDTETREGKIQEVAIKTWQHKNIIYKITFIIFHCSVYSHYFVFIVSVKVKARSFKYDLKCKRS